MVKRKKSKKEHKKSINLLSISISLFSLLFVSYCIYSLYTLLNIKTVDPTSDNISTHKILSQLDTDLKKTIFIFEREKGDKRRISDVFVFLSNEKKEISLLIYLPGSLYFNGLEENFGSPISVSSLRYAGDFLQEGRGVEYALWQTEEILGFKVDNYIWITTEAYENISEIYGDMNEVKEKDKGEYLKEPDVILSESFFKLHTFSSKYSNLKTFFNINKVDDLNDKIYSNLSFLKVLNEVDSFKRNVKDMQTSAIDIGTSKYVVEELSGQGGQIKNINILEYDKSLRGYISKMSDRDLEEERVRIEVYNGSDTPGRASIYARKIQNNGCDVVRFGNAPDSLEKSSVYISDKEKFNDSLYIITEVLLGKFEEASERPSFMTTGDIVILLGEDISQIEIF